jgi:hypothetical protein
MKSEQTAGDILVQEDRPLRLAQARYTRITCVTGCVWITAPGETADIILSPGEHYLCRKKGLTLIEGLGEGWIRLERGLAPTLRRRVIALARLQWQGTISRTDRVALAPG